MLRKLKVPLILFMVFLLFSCSSSKSHNDTDVLPDADSDSQSSEINDEDSEEQDLDFVEDNDDYGDETDVDQEREEDNCYPALDEAKFPYHDEDGKITFCRPKCDTPTEKNPQCVDNLWKLSSKRLYNVSPESECKDAYPCEMPGLRNMTTEDIDAIEDWIGFHFDHRPHECDTIVDAMSKESGDEWGTDSFFDLRRYGMNDGKVGWMLHNIETEWETEYYTTARKAMIYDIASKKYTAVAPAWLPWSAYYKGCFLFVGKDFRRRSVGERYLLYACDDGRMELAYPTAMYFIWKAPAINEKWAIANISETEDGDESTMYARIGEWKWTMLYPDMPVYYPNIVNDKVTFSVPFYKAYYCDLSKNPQSLEECILINEDESEEIENPVINKDNDREIIYGAGGLMKRLVVKENGEKEYSVLLDTFGTTDSVNSPYEHSIRKVTNDMIFYVEYLVVNDSGDANGCFFNRKTNKVSCMKKVEGYDKHNISAQDWEGKWMFYQLYTAWQIIRDLDCYCEKEGVCPFEE